MLSGDEGRSDGEGLMEHDYRRTRRLRQFSHSGRRCGQAKWLVFDGQETKLRGLRMKREGMVPHHPLLVIGHLKHIGAYPASAENQLWRIKRNQEPEPPPVVDSEIFPVGEMILRDDCLACLHHFVGGSELLDDLRQSGGAVHDKAHILRRQRLIECDPLPYQRTAETSGQRREPDYREKTGL